MVVVIKKNTDEEQLNNLKEWLKSFGVDIHESHGEYETVLGLIGDTSHIDTDLLSSLSIIESVTRISEPFKAANRKFHPDDTVIEVAGLKIGGGNFQYIAGPCSVESEEQITYIAKEVKKAGAAFLRGGAFKPRTSPYAFQGMRAEGLRLLEEAKEQTGMPIVTEIMDISHLELFENVDVIQVGARNMQNFELLKELGHTNKPILLKRGLAATIQELLMSAEYIMAGGNDKVILCERGIRTFETYTRNTMDISAIALLKEKTHLPVIADPSHAAGFSRLVKPLALAATAAGADGIMIEVHNDPAHALCDGPQALTPEQFSDVVSDCNSIRDILNK
ncbi:MAG: 3-deoxy-7-phosphoheptulonate synthase [Clostridiales bacterium]|nr:3-deoxy-7-phosphoheptulonate synthase [Clostridia bacterium]MCR4563381.1 3-deoxy-7-phosphoheptulonate synthase [Clostridiales bacterium]